MQWIEITIHTNTNGADAMADVFFSLGIAGVSIEDAADIALYQRESNDWDYIDESIFANRGGDVRVKAYIQDEPHAPAILEAVRQKAKAVADTPGFDAGPGTVETQSLQEEDWSENWKQYYKPFTVGEKLAVTPDWEPYTADDGRCVVTLEPGAAFGTGQHETTYLCLDLCQRYVRPGARVLDVGCGTGILVIAAVLLGAKDCLAVDRDEVAVSACRHNVALNHCEGRVTPVHGNLADQAEGPYDLIFANIVADAVIALLPDAKRLLAENGTIIASGIILDRENDVWQAAKALGLSVKQRQNKGEWVALALEG